MSLQRIWLNRSFDIFVTYLKLASDMLPSLQEVQTVDVRCLSPVESFMTLLKIKIKVAIIAEML